MQIVNVDMESAFTDLQSIAADLPPGQVAQLVKMRELLAEVSNGPKVRMNLQMGWYLGRICTQGTGPAELTPIDR